MLTIPDLCHFPRKKEKATILPVSPPFLVTHSPSLPPFKTPHPVHDPLNPHSFPHKAHPTFSHPTFSHPTFSHPSFSLYTPSSLLYASPAVAALAKLFISWPSISLSRHQLFWVAVDVDVDVDVDMGIVVPLLPPCSSPLPFTSSHPQ